MQNVTRFRRRSWIKLSKLQRINCNSYNIIRTGCFQCFIEVCFHVMDMKNSLVKFATAFMLRRCKIVNFANSKLHLSLCRYVHACAHNVMCTRSSAYSCHKVCHIERKLPALKIQTLSRPLCLTQTLVTLHEMAPDGGGRKQNRY